MARSVPPVVAALAAAAIAITALCPAAATASTSPAPNQGTRGSACKASYPPGAVDPARDMTSLGPQPAAYEVGTPTAGTGRRVMMLIHGGGWYQVGQGMLNSEHPVADAWRAVGWETVNATYRGCRHSLADVLSVYDAVRAQVGPDVPICLKGESAGAQLALLIAARRSDVACVIATAPPTDLWTIKAQGLRAGLGDAPQVVRGLARAAFGRGLLTAMGPASAENAAAIHAPVLLAAAADDFLIPNEQEQELADVLRAAHPGATVDLDLLAPGTAPFVHGTASDAALLDLEQRVARLVAPFGAAPSTHTAPAKVPLITQLLRRLPFFL